MTDGDTKALSSDAVLLLAYGTPDSADGVECFLMDIMGGRQPSPQATEGLRRRYEAIGGVSPLTGITMAQAEALRDVLAARGKGLPVYVGMRHWSPRIADVLREMTAAGVRRATVLLLAPHACDLTEATYRQALEKAATDTGSAIEFEWTGAWSKQPALIEAQAEALREALAAVPSGKRPSVVFSAHSLPARILEVGDPYRDDLLANCEAIASAAGIDGWTFAFQSAGARGGPWLGPDILEHLRALAADGAEWVVSMPIGFICDHLEVLYDLDIEAKQVADELGIGFTRAGMMNTRSHFIDAMADAILS